MLNREAAGKHIKKSVSIAVLIGLSVIGVTGCMSKKEVDRQALEKFEKKYGVDYDVIYNEVIDDSVENRDEIHVYVDGLMEQGETAVIYSWEEDGKAVSEDNLFGFIIREDYENRVREIAEQQFSDVKVYLGGVYDSYDDSLTMESTIEDAYAMGTKIIQWIDILVVTEDDEETFTKKGDVLCTALKDAELNGTVHIFPVTKEAYDQMGRMDYGEKVSLDSKDADGRMPYDAYRGKSY